MWCLSFYHDDVITAVTFLGRQLFLVSHLAAEPTPPRGPENELICQVPDLRLVAGSGRVVHHDDLLTTCDMHVNITSVDVVVSACVGHGSRQWVFLDLRTNLDQLAINAGLSLFHLFEAQVSSLYKSRSFGHRSRPLCHYVQYPMYQ